MIFEQIMIGVVKGCGSKAVFDAFTPPK